MKTIKTFKEYVGVANEANVDSVTAKNNADNLKSYQEYLNKPDVRTKIGEFLSTSGVKQPAPKDTLDSKAWESYTKDLNDALQKNGKFKGISNFFGSVLYQIYMTTSGTEVKNWLMNKLPKFSK